MSALDSVVEQGDGGGATLLTARIYPHSRANGSKRPAKCQKPWGYMPEAQNCAWQARKARKSTDESDACVHAQSVVSDSRRPENKPERIRRPQNRCTRLDSPGRSPGPRPEEPHRPRNHAGALGARTRSALKSMRTWLQEYEDVRKTPNEPKPPNSPIGTKSWRTGWLGEPCGCVNRTDGRAER